MMKRRWVLLLGILNVLILISCAAPIAQKSIVTPNAKFNILIASDGSEFKNVIHNRLIERYKDQCSINNIALKEINKVDSEKYDVIIVMDSCMAMSGFNLRVKKFLDNVSTNENLVLVMTAGDPDWQFNYNGVDAITSASVMENEEKVFILLTMQIDHIIAEIRNK
ncbi:MAG: hypothetical protein PVI90_05740 [Desulfobacteraceae bacterium]|jgi:hypothetical protein